MRNFKQFLEMRKIDNRPPEVVWYWFEKAFVNRDYPDVSSFLGSDWGMGRGAPKPDQYKKMATELMTQMYGPKPKKLHEKAWKKSEPYKLALVSTNEITDEGTLAYVQGKMNKWRGKHYCVYSDTLTVGDTADPKDKIPLIRKLGRR